MNTTHALTFDIDPRGKGRVKFARTGHAYTPASTREYENALAVLAREQFHGEPFTGPLAVTINFYMPTKDKKRWGQWHTMKPDRTNLCKSVEDALNGIVWQDDSLIAVGPLGSKMWAEVGGVVVYVSELTTPTWPKNPPKMPKLPKGTTFIATPPPTSPMTNEVISTDEYLALTHEGKGP